MSEEKKKKLKKVKATKNIKLSIDSFTRHTIGNVEQITIDPEHAAEEYGLPPYPAQRMWGAGGGVMAMWMDDDYFPSSRLEDAECEAAQEDEDLQILDSVWQAMLSEIESWKNIPENMYFAYLSEPTGFPALPTGAKIEKKVSEKVEIEYNFEWDEESQKMIQELEREAGAKEDDLDKAVTKFCKLREEE